MKNSLKKLQDDLVNHFVNVACGNIHNDEKDFTDFDPSRLRLMGYFMLGKRQWSISTILPKTFQYLETRNELLTGLMHEYFQKKPSSGLPFYEEAYHFYQFISNHLPHLKSDYLYLPDIIQFEFTMAQVRYNADHLQSGILQEKTTLALPSWIKTIKLNYNLKPVFMGNATAQDLEEITNYLLILWDPIITHLRIFNLDKSQYQIIKQLQSGRFHNINEIPSKSLVLLLQPYIQ